MKRTSFLQLSDLKLPSRSETKALKAELEAHYDPPPNPALINRRPLSPKLEAELRSACAAVMYGNAYTEQSAKARPIEVTIPRKERRKRADSPPPDGPVVQTRTHRSKEQIERTASSQSIQRLRKDSAEHHYHRAESIQPVIQPNVSRRRGEPLRQDRIKDTLNHTRKDSSQVYQDLLNHTISRPVIERPQTGPFPDPRSDTPETKSSTPMTTSTDRANHSNSTALTSAVLTPNRSSKRGSKQAPSELPSVAHSDEITTEWMRQELERRRIEALRQQERARSRSRSASRTRSITSGIKEYIRPGSSSMSRPASRDSLRSKSSDHGVERSSSTRGWRSWGLQRKGSSSSIASNRPESSRGRSNSRHEEQNKSEINLNRELPPLPKLDQWKEHSGDSPQKQKQAANTHIANLMRSTTAQQVDLSVDHDSKEEITKSSTHYKTQNSGGSSSKSLGNDSTGSLTEKDGRRMSKGLPLPPNQDFHELVSSFGNDMGETELEPQPRIKRTAEPRPHTSIDRQQQAAATAPSSKFSLDQRRPQTPSFSRKISADAARAHTSHGRYGRGAENSWSETRPSTEHKQLKFLRKAISAWMLGGKKEKKLHAADGMQGHGVRPSVMGADEAAGSPVVRY
ncbi:hypothetical protein M501DRAFT_1001272 [Patellaria atrata CBS 101060]|uniref:Uncharacterized protein n=1 Tax=Patellaria atrata CBS 101060 TaxID=1346257 RepID=A0A9P4S1F9_9PEZI|nr:hypothetical protein M501DRAFT_1001272 [Patellaria atrata CBS 101060]